jgi:hypothetical protein
VTAPPPGMTPGVAVWVAELVAAETAYRLRLAREAFAAGRALGRREGRAEEAAEEAARWRVLLGAYGDTMRLPPHAELERRRYGTAGRQSWMVRRDGEPGPGRTPREMRRRARRAGLPDPFHRPVGPAMACTACAHWGLDCPPEEAS